MDVEGQIEAYALFKQGTAGDVLGSKPITLHALERRKWEAWYNKKGMPKDVALRKYLCMVRGPSPPPLANSPTVQKTNSGKINTFKKTLSISSQKSASPSPDTRGSPTLARSPSPSVDEAMKALIQAQTQELSTCHAIIQRLQEELEENRCPENALRSNSAAAELVVQLVQFTSRIDSSGIELLRSAVHHLHGVAIDCPIDCRVLSEGFHHQRTTVPALPCDKLKAAWDQIVTGFEDGWVMITSNEVGSFSLYKNDFSGLQQCRRSLDPSRLLYCGVRHKAELYFVVYKGRCSEVEEWNGARDTAAAIFRGTQGSALCIQDESELTDSTLMASGSHSAMPHPCQAAGHGDLKTGPCGTVRKPAVKNEVWAYSQALSAGGMLRSLAPYIPRYYGVQSVDGEEYIVLEDLSLGFKEPHAIDIKVGLIQHNRTMSSSKIAKVVAKCAESTSSTIGLRLCGATTIPNSRERGKTATSDHFGELVWESLQFSERRARHVLDEVKAIYAACEDVVLYVSMLSTSILITFDGIDDAIVPRVRLIDLANCCAVEEAGYEDRIVGFLQGLDCLMKILEK
jgi:hypothetical protein